MRRKDNRWRNGDDQLTIAPFGIRLAACSRALKL
jgi:hypothetical protein